MNGSYLYFVNKHLLVGRYWDFNAFFSTFSYITATSAHIHVFNQCFGQYSFQVACCFPKNNCGKNDQQYERNESCRNNYHQSSEGHRPSRGSSKLTPLLKSCTLAIELKGARLDNSTESARPSQHVDPSFMTYEVFKYIRVRAWLSGKEFDS